MIIFVRKKNTLDFFFFVGKCKMSQKTGKRNRRRTEEMDPDYKSPVSHKKDSSNIEDVDGNNKNGIEGEETDLKGFSATEINSSVEPPINDKSLGPTTRSRSTTPQNKKDFKNGNSIEANETNNKENVEEQVDDKNESQDTEIEMEPLVDTEEQEPELQFDENSEPESRKDSPLSNRCMTRRSQTRNIPTPKTPKSIDESFEEKLSDDSEKTIETPVLSETLHINLEETVVAAPAVTEEPVETHISDYTSDVEESESFKNLSTYVVVDGDTTRNADFSVLDDQTEFSNSFINLSKDLSLGESLRGLSSRRPIHSIGVYPKKIFKHSASRSITNKLRTSVERIHGIKRKKHSESPENLKRIKPNGPGFLSYLSSPIINIKNKFYKPEVPSNSPKLTGYKGNIFENPNLSKIETDINDSMPERKTCIIM